MSNSSLLSNINKDIRQVKGLKSVDSITISGDGMNHVAVVFYSVEGCNVDIAISTEEELTHEERMNILKQAKDIVSSYKKVNTSTVSLNSTN